MQSFPSRVRLERIALDLFELAVLGVEQDAAGVVAAGRGVLVPPRHGIAVFFPLPFALVIGGGIDRVQILLIRQHAVSSLVLSTKKERLRLVARAGLSSAAKGAATGRRRHDARCHAARSLPQRYRPRGGNRETKRVPCLIAEGPQTSCLMIGSGLRHGVTPMPALDARAGPPSRATLRLRVPPAGRGIFGNI